METELTAAQLERDEAMAELVKARRKQNKSTLEMAAARYRYVLANSSVRALEADLTAFPNLQ